METHCSYIPYQQTGFFSKLVTDYLNHSDQLKAFYNFPSTIEGLQSSINQRKNFSHRKVLVDQLQQQYQNLQIASKVSSNLELLLQENTFTITTAHQPNIFTGPLYVVYKIFHAIKLAEELKTQLPQYNFVPVYYMGSEDADLDELNNITISQRKYVWETRQTGAVGRMKVDKQLLQLINEIEGQISVQKFGNELIEIFRASYKDKSSIQQATLQLLNALFGEYGLIVLIPDDAAFKKIFQPVIAKELKEQFSYKAVSETAKNLETHYKLQAAGREINLFYLIDDKRERIEFENTKYEVRSLNKNWNEDEILKELDEHPERFSPNVILRGALQESILPNIAFIGGGGELAYWLELKEVFNQANVPYPVLLLRNSFLLIDDKQQTIINKLKLTAADFFDDEQSLMKKIVDINTDSNYALNGELKKFEDLYSILESRSNNIDVTLTKHIEAIKTKALKKLTELEKKLLRAEKRKFAEQQQHIQKIKSLLFPNDSLQERTENISGFYSVYGKEIFDKIYASSKGLQQQFGIINL